MCNLNSDSIVHNHSQILNEQKLNHIHMPMNTTRYFCASTHDGCIQVFDLDSSPIKTMKATSTLMKSSINSTNGQIIAKQQQQEQQQPIINKHEIKQHNVSKRTQNLLNNTQIFTKLTKILKCYNEYPARYRMFIWKTLLKLPENYESYASLIERGTHPAYTNLAKKYPLKSQKCIRLLERTLSALAHWSPIFAECDYLPLLIFPFVKLFQNNQVVCFEICASLICNWCQYWFEFFPNPPMNILNMIENLLSYHDRTLLDHYMRYRITCQIYGWSLLETIFSEVFSKLEWQILFDNIFSNHPGFLLYLIVAYSICNRTALMQVKELDDARYFFRHRNPLSVHHLLQESNRMQQTTPADLDPCKMLDTYEPLSKGTYPVFNKRPRFITDYQNIEKTKILQQEINYLKEREQHLESHKLNEGRKLENEYLLKQMLWDNKLHYKQSVEEYERKQKHLEQLRFQKQQHQQQIINSEFKDPMKILVAGEPVITQDKRGNNIFNKMKKIDENFDDIQTMLNNNAKLKSCLHDNQFNDETEQDLTEENFKDIENELIANRANALINNNNYENNDIVSNNTKCLNESEQASICKFFYRLKFY